jgi:hypothetical protein
MGREDGKRVCASNMSNTSLASKLDGSTSQIILGVAGALYRVLLCSSPFSMPSVFLSKSSQNCRSHSCIQESRLMS